MRKLYTHPTICKHYTGKPGGIVERDLGVTLRIHVGGPDFGWMARLPCVESSLSRDVVPCGKRELPTDEEVERDKAELTRQLNDMFSGKCPDCGRTLEVRENDDVKISACPAGCVSARECKRIGEHP